MADIEVINIVVFDIIHTLIRVVLNQNCNAVFILSTAVCFILTVALDSLFYVPCRFRVNLGDCIINSAISALKSQKKRIKKFIFNIG